MKCLEIENKISEMKSYLDGINNTLDSVRKTVAVNLMKLQQKLSKMGSL